MVYVVYCMLDFLGDIKLFVGKVEVDVWYVEESIGVMVLVCVILGVVGVLFEWYVLVGFLLECIVQYV